MAFAGLSSREMQVTMKIDGNNPDLYGGYPVSFNFGVSGKLDQVLSRQTLAGTMM